MQKKGGGARVNAKPSNPFEQLAQKKATKNTKKSGNGTFQRKQTALNVEIDTDHKVNRFVDKRSGESYVGLSAEDKALLRYQKQAKKRYAKNSIYNLEEEEDLTHLGASLGEFDEIEDDLDIIEDDEEEFSPADLKTVTQLNFGGFEEDNKEGPVVKKSRQEIMSELIARSKLYKAERVKEKQELEDITKDLDEELPDLQLLLTKSTNSTKSNKDSKDQDDYDIMVRELAFEARSKPTDRLKTPEEIALQQKQALEKLEQDRVRRMRGNEEDDIENASKRVKITSADDLDDSFTVSNHVTPLYYGDDDSLVQQIDVVNRNNNVDTEEDNVIENDDEDDEQEEENAEDEEEEEEEENEEEEESNEEGENKEIEFEFSEQILTSSNYSKIKPVSMESIPFTLTVPETYSEFLKYIKNKTLKEKAVIIQRIITCNNIRVNSENKINMVKFYSILVQHFINVSNSNTFKIKELNYLTKVLWELNQDIPQECSLVYKEQLQSIQDTLAKRVFVNTQNSVWPNAPSIFFFKLLSNIYPVTDYQHPIITPSLLILGEYLSMCAIRNNQDIIKGLFICNLVHHYVSTSKRYIPEAIFFLHNVLNMFLTSDLLIIKKGLNKISVTGQNEMPISVILQETPEFSNQNKVNILSLALSTLSDFVTLYSKHGAFSEIFYETPGLLSKLGDVDYHSSVKAIINNLVKVVQTNIEDCVRMRIPLELHAKKAPSIKLLNPNFEEKTYIDKKAGRNAAKPDQAKIQALQRKVKREKKQTVKQIRQENWALAAEKNKRQKVVDDEREKAKNKIMAMLGQEQSQHKKEQKMKRKSAF